MTLNFYTLTINSDFLGIIEVITSFFISIPPSVHGVKGDMKISREIAEKRYFYIKT